MNGSYVSAMEMGGRENWMELSDDYLVFSRLLRKVKCSWHIAEVYSRPARNIGSKSLL